MRLTASDVAVCTGGELHGPDAAAQGISFDTRTMLPGQAFVAIVAGRDGHDHLADARGRGAPFAIVGRGRCVPGMTCVEVDDTSAAIVSVGRLCRDRLQASAPGRVIAVTGSAGKTSTKDFLVAVLCAQWPSAHGAHLSFNNDLGVPVTLANAPDDCPAVVVEMGMRGHGEISRLCETARPDIGLVTVVGDAHGERVGGIEGVARAKAELVAALPRTGTAVLNADDDLVAAMARRTGASVLTYGTSDGADVQFRVAGVDADGLHTIDISWSGETERVTVPLPGLHMASNACGAVAAGVAAGVPFGAAAMAVSSVDPSPGRMQWRTASDGTRVLDDTYNANPSSMAAALEVLAAVDADRRYAVLGAMAEISDPAASHAEVAERCAALGVVLVAVGTDLYGIPAMDPAGAASAVAERGGRVAVLVKGSRSARTERVVDLLLA